MPNLIIFLLFSLLYSCVVSASNTSKTVSSKYFPMKKELTKGKKIELKMLDSHMCYELKLKDKFLAWVTVYHYYKQGIIVRRCIVKKSTNSIGARRIMEVEYNPFFEKISFTANKKPIFKKLKFKLYDYFSGVNWKNNYLAYWGFVRPDKYNDVGDQAKYHAMLFDLETEKILVDKLLGKCKIIKKYVNYHDGRTGHKAPIIDLKNRFAVFDPSNAGGIVDCNFSTTTLKY